MARRRKFPPSARERMNASRAVIERLVDVGRRRVRREYRLRQNGLDAHFARRDSPPAAQSGAQPRLRRGRAAQRNRDARDAGSARQRLAKGFSGVRPLVAETLVAMLNRGVHPVIPSQGSVGASGDLAPLAHLAQVAIGEGEAIYRGGSMPAPKRCAPRGSRRLCSKRKKASRC